ncbi:MAG TPA: DUF447 domain-containing protein [Pirellulales bacterium]|jgi:hypothetical protein
MILEGIVTTVNADGTVNIAPMGPLVDDEITHLTLRPFQTSTTFQNLMRTRQGVFHVTDDVELLAHAAIDRIDRMPPLVRAERVEGWILADSCRWFAFEVRDADIREARSRMEADVVDHGHLREFFGFNRAKHAVVEAAILATRVHLLEGVDLLNELARLVVMVEKTGGDQERRAFDFLSQYIRSSISAASAAKSTSAAQQTTPRVGSAP